MKKKYIFLHLLASIVTIIGCSESKDNINHKCSFQELSSYENKVDKKNGGQISGGINGVLNSNLKKFIQFDVNISQNDTFDFNRIHEQLYSRVTYDDDFISKHNVLVQLLCSIEYDIKIETDSVIKRSLILDRIEKRNIYFDLLMNKEQEKLPTQLVDSTLLLEDSKTFNHLNESPKKMDTEKYSITIISKPVGASIYIDNKFLGSTGKDIFLQKGEFHLKISKDGFYSYEDIINSPVQNLISVILERRNDE